MTIRYTIGPFGQPSWRCLAISVELLRRLEPTAIFHVSHQGPILRHIPNVRYHPQDAALNYFGKYIPSRWNIQDHEVWLDNDHIMWSLPPAWERFKARRDAALVWRVDHSYHGSYAGEIWALRGDGWQVSAGMWGLPPGIEMPCPVSRGDDPPQEEMGGCALFLAGIPEHEEVWEKDEVRIYHPFHSAIKGRDKIGIHGVHLMNLNPGWNGGAEPMMDWIEKTYGIKT